MSSHWRGQQHKNEDRPSDCVDLHEISHANAYAKVSVMGIVTDFMRPVRSQGADWQLTCTINEVNGPLEGVRVRIFKPHENDLPQIKQTGDVLLIKHGYIKEFRGERIVVAPPSKCSHIVFSADSIPTQANRRSSLGNVTRHESFPAHLKPTVSEELWAIHLKSGIAIEPRSIYANKPMPNREPLKPQSGNTPQTRNSPSPQPKPNFKDKRSLISNVKENSFYDLVGEVVKMYNNPFGNCLELYITDYTEHSELRDHATEARTYNASKPWPGPTGKRTIKIEVHPPHAATATQILKERDIALLQNVRIKQSRGNAELEGNIWPDKLNPQRINVSKAAHDDQRAVEIRTRKTQLLMHGAHSPNEKQLKKREKKQRRQAAASTKRKHAALEDSNNDLNNTETDHSPPIKALRKYTLNPNILIQHPDQRLSTFSSIPHNPTRIARSDSGETFPLPFVDCKHVAHLRVVDFFPHDLRDFAVRRPTPTASQDPTQEWQWNFWLVVVAGNPDECIPASTSTKSPNPPHPRQQEEKEEGAIELLVTGTSAQTLLGAGLRPRNLHHPPSPSASSSTPTSTSTHNSALQTLTRLSQRLFTLWGDLAELKEAYLSAHPDILPDARFSARKAGIKPSSLPFVGCVQEFGVPKRRSAVVGGEEEEGERQKRMDRDAKDPDMGWVREWRLFGTEIV